MKYKCYTVCTCTCTLHVYACTRVHYKILVIFIIHNQQWVGNVTAFEFGIGLVLGSGISLCLGTGLWYQSLPVASWLSSCVW